MFDYTKVHFNVALFLREMERRGIALASVPDTDLICATLGRHTEYLQGMLSRIVPSVYSATLEDKYYSKKLLQMHSIPVVPGRVFSSGELEVVKKYVAEELGYPVVIKPTNTDSGTLVFASIETEAELCAAYGEIGRAISENTILVERHFNNCGDYRFFVSDVRSEIPVVRRTPARVVGDGHATIGQLIARQNHARMHPRSSCLCEIYVDDNEGRRCIAKQGLTLDSVVAQGEEVVLRYNANVSWGGDCENVAQQMHPSYFDVIRRIYALFPGLPFLFVDLLIRDHRLPATATNYVVCEFHLNFPGLSLFQLPGRGAPQDVISPLVDMLFPETALASSQPAAGTLSRLRTGLRDLLLPAAAPSA